MKSPILIEVETAKIRLVTAKIAEVPSGAWIKIRRINFNKSLLRYILLVVTVTKFGNIPHTEARYSF